MRAYTLSVLSQLASSGDPIVESAIIDWANAKLESAGKTSRIKNFQDSSIRQSIVILDLIDAIKPGIINYELVSTEGTEEVTFNLTRFSNLSYKFHVYKLKSHISVTG